MIVLDLDDRARGFLVIAIDDLRRRLAYTGIQPPAGIDELAAALRSRLTQAQPGSPFDAQDDLADPEAMHRQPLALSYDEAAAALGVSRSSLKRLVADDRLPTVSIGGAIRIRATDLEGYVSALTVINRGAA